MFATPDPASVALRKPGFRLRLGFKKGDILDFRSTLERNYHCGLSELHKRRPNVAEAGLGRKLGKESVAIRVASRVE